MLLKIHRGNYSTPEARQKLAQFLSTTISGTADTEPYLKNAGDDSVWTIDQAGNNWSLRFFNDKPDQIEIWHRYQCPGNPFEQALGHWLAFRLNAEILPEPIPRSDAKVARVVLRTSTRHSVFGGNMCPYVAEVLYVTEKGEKYEGEIIGVTEAETEALFLLQQTKALQGKLLLREGIRGGFEILTESTIYPGHTL